MKLLNRQGNITKFPETKSGKYNTSIWFLELGDERSFYFKVNGSNFEPRSISLGYGPQRDEHRGREEWSVIRDTENNWIMTPKRLWRELYDLIMTGGANDGMITLRVIPNSRYIMNMSKGEEPNSLMINYNDKAHMSGRANFPASVLDMMKIKVAGGRTKR